LVKGNNQTLGLWKGKGLLAPSLKFWEGPIWVPQFQGLGKANLKL